MINEKDLESNGWTRRDGGTFYKFEVEGDTLEGIYRGIRDGPYGPLGVLVTDDGERSFKMYASLARQLAGVVEGTPTRLDYRGEKESRQGRMYKDFAVYTKDLPQREEPPF